MSESKFPRSLDEVPRPTLEEVQAAIAEGERMMERFAAERRGKIAPIDQDMMTTVIYIPEP